jgi:hypothetical protein
LYFYEVSRMIYLPMNEETIILALQKKLKEDMDIPENVHFNDGMITAIEEVKKQYLLEEQKKQTS